MSRLHRYLYVILKFTIQTETTRIIFENAACSDRDELPIANFQAVLGKVEADMLQITKIWNWQNELSSTKDVVESL